MNAVGSALECALGAESVWVREVDLLNLLGLDEAELARAIAELSAVGNVNCDAATRRVGVIRLVRGHEVARAENEYSAEFVTALDRHVAQWRRTHARCG
jgi:hypothetical protein